MRFSIFASFTAAVILSTSQAVLLDDKIELAQSGAESEMLGALTGGGGGGGGSGGGAGCAQNTPAINIIDNARIMMMPGNIPSGGCCMAETDKD